MRIDRYGQHIYSESDLCDLIMRGHDLTGRTAFLTDTVDLTAIRYQVDELPQIERYLEQDLTPEEFDRLQQSHWLMPDSYQNLDIAKYVLDLCSDSAELQRAGEELLLFAEREMLDLLRYLVYIVDVMRSNSIVWGVGRGSSVASFVLYKIGVHRVNSLYYDIDIREFLR